MGRPEMQQYLDLQNLLVESAITVQQIQKIHSTIFLELVREKREAFIREVEN